MKLFETTTSELTCSFCNYYGAISECESRADFESEEFPDFPFDTLSYCPLCGWTQYEMEDEDIWYEIAAHKGIDLESEDADEMLERILPPNPLESPPDRKELAAAKEVVAKILNRAQDAFYEPVEEYIFRDWSNFDVKTLESFKRGFLLYIFEKLR